MPEAETMIDGLPALQTIWSADSIAQSQPARSLLFQSRDQVFAVATEFVAEVIEAPEVFPLPGAPWWYRGLAGYKSRPVPVIDPVQYFVPASAKPEKTHTRAIVVMLASSTYLFSAEKVLNLCQLNMSRNEVFNSDQNLTEHPAISGICQYDNKLVAVIDTPEFLRQTRLLRESV